LGKGLKSADFEMVYGYYLKLEPNYLRNKTHVLPRQRIWECSCLSLC